MFDEVFAKVFLLLLVIFGVMVMLVFNDETHINSPAADKAIEIEHKNVSQGFARTTPIDETVSLTKLRNQHDYRADAGVSLLSKCESSCRPILEATAPVTVTNQTNVDLTLYVFSRASLYDADRKASFDIPAGSTLQFVVYEYNTYYVRETGTRNVYELIGPRGSVINEFSSYDLTIDP